MLIFSQYSFAWLNTIYLLLILPLSACEKTTTAPPEVDVVLIGGGIMSTTLGSMLHELDESLRISLFERLDRVALESSAAWNNAGTGHAAFSELNYTPEQKDGSINIKKAIEVSVAFEISKQYWAHLAKNGVVSPPSFIHNVPHMSFVFGENDVAFLKKRYDTMVKHPLFKGMEYSEEFAQIKLWAPLIADGRDPSQKIALTRMNSGVDVDFGLLTERMFDHLARSKSFELNVMHDVLDLKRNDDKTWTVVVQDKATGEKRSVRAKFVFIGAGGGSLALLQKSGIDEANGFGGFPVGGAWLVTTRQDLVDRHQAKVYGKAAVGSPPMSVPHLDKRFIDGKEALLFGPFATFSTKFLKHGSWSDLLASVSVSNFLPMVNVGISNLDLVGYLINQVMLSKDEQVASLKEYFPNAQSEDWRFLSAGQRVQVIKKDQNKGGILQFGTELVSSKDHSLVALLGASPGASTAVQTMLNVLELSFADLLNHEQAREKLKEMIPSYGQDLALDGDLIMAIREQNRNLLELTF